MWFIVEFCRFVSVQSSNLSRIIHIPLQFIVLLSSILAINNNKLNLCVGLEGPIVSEGDIDQFRKLL